MAIFFTLKKVLSITILQAASSICRRQMDYMDKRLTGLAFWTEERDNTDGIALTMKFMPARLIDYGPKPRKRGRPERLNLW